MSDQNEISIADTLELINGKYYDVFAHFAQGGYAFWLGSAISKDRVIGLHGVLSKLLEFLRVHSTQNDDCVYKKALQEVLSIAGLTTEELALTNFSKPITDWPNIKEIVNKLWNSYSEVLSVKIKDKPLDYLLWDGLDFKSTFANQVPDLEHLAIGMLALEGVVRDVATANWDGLLEAAMKELGHEGDGYQVTVTGQDLQGPEACSTLYKFHGCALRAINDEGSYRKLLIARDAQIHGWIGSDTFKIVRDQLHALIQRRRTMIIGLSGQDSNIKFLFGGVGEGKVWQWDNCPTPIVISSLNIGADQKSLLSGMYGEVAFEAHYDEILENAAFPAYSKSFLAALLLDVLTKKIVTLASDADAPKMKDADTASIAVGLEHLRNRAAVAGENDRFNLVNMIAQTTARARHQLQDGNSHSGAQKYYPLDNVPIHLMKDKQALSSTGMREAAVAVGLIGTADKKGDWVVSVDDPKDASSGALRISTEHVSSRVFLAANDDIITDLISCGAFSEDDSDAVVVCSKRVSQRQQRNPSANLPGARGGPRYIAFGPMLKDSDDFDQLFANFRQEVAI